MQKELSLRMKLLPPLSQAFDVLKGFSEQQEPRKLAWHLADP
jgi:hypothetical protein